MLGTTVIVADAWHMVFRLAQEVHVAPLPASLGQHPHDRLFEALMLIGDDEIDGPSGSRSFCANRMGAQFRALRTTAARPQANRGAPGDASVAVNRDRLHLMRVSAESPQRRSLPSR
jgi:hypothetical protein